MGNPNMIMSLAGNKADLAEQRAVSEEDAKVKPAKPFLIVKALRACISSSRGPRLLNKDKEKACWKDLQIQVALLELLQECKGIKHPVLTPTSTNVLRAFM